MKTIVKHAASKQRKSVIRKPQKDGEIELHFLFFNEG